MTEHVQSVPEETTVIQIQLQVAFHVQKEKQHPRKEAPVAHSVDTVKTFEFQCFNLIFIDQ